MIHTALEAGAGWFDTAPYYGGGLSETYLGTALALVPRSRYVLSTKVGRYLQADGGTRFDLSREGIVRSVEESLRRLQVTSIEMLLLHDPDALYREALWRLPSRPWLICVAREWSKPSARG